MIERIARENLLAIIAAFRKATGQSETAVSKAFYGNSTFVRDVRRGTLPITLPRLDKMMATFRAKWPDGARWPLTRAIHMGRNPQE